MPDPTLPVYVIHWNAADVCLATIEALRRSAGVELVLHVVDNSPGELAERLRGVAGSTITLLETDRNIGFAGAANVALAHCRAVHPEATRCLIAAHDLRPGRGCLRALLDAASSLDRVAVAGPRFDGDVVGATWSGLRGRWHRRPPPYPDVVDVDWLLGACLLLDLRWVDEHGGFEARLGSYVEDVELCLRARDTGWRVLCVPAAEAQDVARSASDVTRAVDFNGIAVVVKRGGRAAVARPLLLVLWLTVRGVGAALSPRRTGERRQASLAHVRSHARAALDVLLRWRLLRDLARHPERGCLLPDLNDRLR